jgi:repressor LexA
MYIGEIIKDYRLKNKLSQRTFASRTSLSPSYINTLEKVFNPKNGKPYSVTTSVALELSQAMNITIEELLSKLNEDQEFTLNEKEKGAKYYMCPVYGRISAGQPNWAEECIEGRIPIDPDLMNITEPEECFFLKVNGESMNKEIKNGAYALIRKTDVVENGDIAVVLVNGYDATLKKFTKNGDVVVLEPMSNDPSFQTQIYTKETPIKIIGKYIGKMEMK